MDGEGRLEMMRRRSESTIPPPTHDHRCRLSTMTAILQDREEDVWLTLVGEGGGNACT